MKIVARAADDPVGLKPYYEPFQVRAFKTAFPGRAWERGERGERGGMICATALGPKPRFLKETGVLKFTRLI
jgi:hypothetical protein